MKLLVFTLLACLLASPSMAKPKQFGEITVAERRHQRGEPCKGGNISAILGLRRVPDERVSTKDLSLQRLVPGRYFVYYGHSKFSPAGTDCYEISPPTETPRDWSAVPKIELEVVEGKVYSLSLGQDLAPQVQVLDELPVTESMIGGAVTLASSIHLWSEICADIFPDDENKLRRRLASSSVQIYTEVFGLAGRSRIPREGRAKRLKQAGQTESQAIQWCSVQLPKAIEDFDYSYGDRLSDIQAFLLKSKKN